MLLEANIIRLVRKDITTKFYEIVNMEDARQYEYKPLHTGKWWNLTKDVEGKQKISGRS